MQYMDTSALLKRYVLEPQTARVNTFFEHHAPITISYIVLLEIRCALARRVRAKELTQALALEVLEAIDLDIKDGTLQLAKIQDSSVVAANDMIEAMPQYALRGMDALHLGLAQQHGASTFVTTDAIQAEVARALGFNTITF